MTKLIRCLFSSFIVMVLASGCAPQTTKIEEFPRLYEEQPTSILILPPMNESTAADAKEYYSTTIQEPLAYSGYYTLPYVITSDMLKMEGIYDSELLVDVPLGKFKEYFGADAVLFTKIKQWDLSYLVVASTLTVSIDSVLKSTTSNEVLWNYTGTVVVDLSGGVGNGGGVIGLALKVVVIAINSAMAEYVKYAREANYKALATMPFGKYHLQHNKDQNIQFIDLTPEEK